MPQKCMARFLAGQLGDTSKKKEEVKKRTVDKLLLL